MKKIVIKRGHPKSDDDFSQEPKVIDEDVEEEFDSKAFALESMTNLSRRYSKALSALISVHGNLADISSQHKSLLDLMEMHNEHDKDEHDDFDDDDD